MNKNNFRVIIICAVLLLLVANTAYSLTYKEYSAGTGIQIDANASSYQVQPGELINLTVTCSNVDTWVEYEQADGSNPPEAVIKSSGSSKDMLKLPWWSCSDGRFDCPQGDDIYWQAPDEPGTYKITVEVENKNENQFADEKGVREIEIEVLGEGGESSGRQDSLNKDAQQGNENAAANQDAMAGGGQEKDTRLASADLNTLLNDLPPIVPLSDKFNTQMMSDLSYDNSPPFNERASRDGDEVKVTETKTETDTGTMWSKVIDYASETFDLTMGYAVYVAEQAVTKGKEAIAKGKEVVDYLNSKTEEFRGLKEPETQVRSSGDTVTIDLDLNYYNLFEKGEEIIGIADLITVGRFAEKRWDNATKDAVSDYEQAVNEGKKAVSISGANTDGEMLDKLTQALAKELNATLTTTHSAGIDTPINSNVTTKKLMSICPQATREELEAWIDKLGLAKEDVIVVTVEGDLPYHPEKIVDVKSMVENSNLPTGAMDSIISSVKNAVANTPNKDYESPSDKYTHVHIEAGKGVGENPLDSHMAAVKYATTEEKYTVSVDGVRHKDKVALGETYKSILEGKF